MNNINIKEELTIILNEIREIKKEITCIKKELVEMKTHTQKMDEHIDFVNGVYDNMERPLNYLCSKVSNAMNYKSFLSLKN